MKTYRAQPFLGKFEILGILGALAAVAFYGAKWQMWVIMLPAISIVFGLALIIRYALHKDIYNVEARLMGDQLILGRREGKRRYHLSQIDQFGEFYMSKLGSGFYLLIRGDEVRFLTPDASKLVKDIKHRYVANGHAVQPVPVKYDIFATVRKRSAFAAA